MSFYIVAQSDPDKDNDGHFICRLNKTLQFDTDYDVAIAGINRYAKFESTVASPGRNPIIKTIQEYPKISAGKDIIEIVHNYITRLPDPTWAIKDENDDFDITLHIGGADSTPYPIKLFPERCIRKSRLNTFEKTFDDYRLVITEMDKLFKVKLEFVGRPLTRPPIHEIITTPYFSTSKPAAIASQSKSSTSANTSKPATFMLAFGSAWAEQLYIQEAEHTIPLNIEKALRTAIPAWEALEQNHYVASWGYDIYDVNKRGSKVLEITPFRKNLKAPAYYIKVLEKTLHPFYLAAGDRFIPMAVGDRWMRVSSSLLPLFKLQNKEIEAMKGHEIKLYYNGALLLTHVLDTIPKIEKVFETLQNLVNIYEQPNYVKVSIAPDKKVTIAYSKEIDIKLPYVLRDYPIIHVKESERFTYTIIYKHSKSNSKISEKRKIKFANDAEKTRPFSENKIKSE